jgi:TPR repeat protein
VPVRIEDVLPQGDLEYFLSSSHWMDAISPPVERHFDALAQQLEALLQLERKPSATPTGSSSQVLISPPRSSGPSVRLMILGAIAVLIVVGGVAAFLLRSRHEEKQMMAATTHPETSQPQATSLPEVAPTVPGISSTSPAPPPPVAEGPLANEYRDWKKLTLITWDNYYLIDHARQRYAGWRRAADQGDAIGEFFVGYCYQHGLTVPEEPATAFEWFMKSATQRNTDAMLEVAICSAFGLGTQQNAWEYARWIKEAVDAGNTSAMVAMGVGLYSLPVGPTDKEQGKQWIAKAAAAGNFDGVFWVGVTNSNSAVEVGAQLQKAAAAGQPDALIAIVENDRANPQGRNMVAKALKTMGNPLMVARIIDPTLPGGFYHNNVFPDLTVARLRAMSGEGSAEATRLLGTLMQTGKIPSR